MNISFIPREKAESLAQTKPFLLSPVTLSPHTSRFLMITTPGILTTAFDLAVINEDKEIEYISNKSLEGAVRSFLDSDSQ